MGYTTEFHGSFKLNKCLSKQLLKYLKLFNYTRRMKRNFPDNKYGVEGEFYVDGTGFMGQDHESNIVDYNKPPCSQPSLWCQWGPNEDGTEIIWDGGEKFYNYIEWIIYIITRFLEPNGYKLNDCVDWIGEDPTDTGTIKITDNCVNITKHYSEDITYISEGLIHKIHEDNIPSSQIGPNDIEPISTINETVDLKPHELNIEI